MFVRALNHTSRHAALAALLCVAYPSTLCAQAVPEAAPSAPAPAPAATVLPVADLKPMASAPPGSVKLTLRTPETVTFVLQRDEGSSQPERQCNGDCEAEVTPGTYRIALAHGLRAAVEVPGRYRLGGDGVLEGQYLSARPKRIAGGIVLGLGLPASLGMLFGGIATNASLPEGSELGGGTKASIALGAILTALTAAVGGYLVSRKDEARVLARGPELEALTTPAFEPPAPAIEPPAPLAPTPAAPAPVVVAPVAQGKVAAPKVARPVTPAPKASSNPDDAKELSRHRRALEDCVERELVVRLLVGADGKPKGAHLPASDGMTTTCLKTVFGAMRFPAGPERSLSFRVKPARDSTF